MVEPAATSLGVSVLCTTNVPSADAFSIDDANVFEELAESSVTPPVGAT
ncbi:MAG TPA: hypothetical protein VK669_09195 [Candidatus Limnocylindrales bacterium]|nr:hypothetical protein [Candidatus Limnocylindrales bacterium]